MIYDSLKNIEAYKDMPQIYRALQIIRDTDFSVLEDGAHEVDGFNFRYLLQSYETKKVNERPEAHRSFIDIQFLLSGSEQIGIGQVADMTEEVEANPDGDIWFYHGPLQYLTLKDDRFMIFFPQDAHAPCSIPQEGGGACRKVCFKIHV